MRAGGCSNAAGTLLSGMRRPAHLRRRFGITTWRFGFCRTCNAVTAVTGARRQDPAVRPGALFGCAVITGVGAVVNTAQVSPAARVAVVGLGGVGLAALLGARAQGALDLIAVDISDAKLELARELGATHAFNAQDPDCVARIREVTRGGVDYAFEMAGSVKAMTLAYEITRRGGTTVTAGLPDPAARFSISHVNLVAEERTVKGSLLR